jgi:hypothetical protein
MFWRFGIHFAMRVFRLKRINQLCSNSREGVNPMVWKGLSCMAAVAVLGCGSAAFAADIQQADAASGVSTPSALAPLQLDATSAPAGPTSLTPLMFALDPTPVGQWLEKNHIAITGFVEGGYFIDANNDNRGKDQPTLIAFPGAFSQNVLLDQLDLSISKTIDSTKSFDWGFMFENGYGIDDAQIHSNGMLDNAPFPHPREQYDIIQANGSVLLPIGTGLTVTAGKFVALLGQEVINPTGNQFYTHSYSFTFADPATNTGILAAYTFPKLLAGNDLSVTGGISRGWNQSTKDDNGAIDFLGQAKANFSDKLSWLINTEIGPEAAGDNADYWTTIELILTYKASDELTLASDIIYNDFPHGAATNPGDPAQWYGIAGYAAYKFDSYFTPQLRAEWFRDQGGFATGTQANYYEFTGGVQIHPMPNDNYFQYLQLRPEIREDIADRRVYGGGRGQYTQFSAAMDVIMQF